MSDPNTVVRAMIAACGRRDMEGVLACFHTDAVYHNMPMPPVSGHDGIRVVLDVFFRAMEEVDWVIHNELSNGVDLVMNERTDRFRSPKGWVELPVMGVFEVRDGLIAAWRDYFDMAPAQALMEWADPNLPVY